MGGMRWSGPATAGHGRIGIVPEIGSQWSNDIKELDGSINQSSSVEYRRGFEACSCDVGAKLRFLGGEIGTRWSLAKSDAAEGSVGLAVRGGTLFYTMDTTTGFDSAVDPSFRMGVNVSKKSQLAFGVTPSLVYAHESQANGAVTRNGISVAPSLTVAMDVGVSNGFHVVPEVGAQTFIGSDSFHYTDNTIRLRAAVGFYF